MPYMCVFRTYSMNCLIITKLIIECMQGYRPSTPFIVNLLADSSKNAPWQQALVQTLEAIQLHVSAFTKKMHVGCISIRFLQTPVPIEVGCSILERAMSYPSDPMYTKAVKKLTDSMLFSTAGISSLAGRQAASLEGEERMQGGPTAWSDAQVSVLVQVCSPPLMGLFHFCSSPNNQVTSYIAGIGALQFI